MSVRAVRQPTLHGRLLGLTTSLLHQAASTRRATSSTTSRQDPVALAREVARLRTQLHEARRELRASDRELRVARAAAAAASDRRDNAASPGTSAGPSSATPPGLSRSLTELASGSQSRRRFRILALDGGGIRGIFTVHVLRRLIKEEPRLLDSIDLIAGTSTGAVIGARHPTYSDKSGRFDQVG